MELTIHCERMRARLTEAGCLRNQQEAANYLAVVMYSSDSVHMARWDKAQKCPKCERWTNASPDRHVKAVVNVIRKRKSTSTAVLKLRAKEKAQAAVKEFLEQKKAGGR